MYIQDSFVANMIKASLDDVLGSLDFEDTLHEEVAHYLTDVYFGSGLIVDDSVEAIQEILDYMSANAIKTKLSVTDSDDRDLPDSFTLILTVNILDITLEFQVNTNIRRQYQSVFP
jgi:hypothetical protein